MLDIGSSELDVALHALSEQLAVVGAHEHLVVIGGSGLIAIEAITRATRDVDILALEVDGALISAEPLPHALAHAAALVARDLGLEANWAERLDRPACWTSGCHPGSPSGLFGVTMATRCASRSPHASTRSSSSSTQQQTGGSRAISPTCEDSNRRQPSCTLRRGGLGHTTCRARSTTRWHERSASWRWRMKAATLRDEIIAALHEHAWDQWSQLGVSGPAPKRREERAADPEALLLFTLEIGRCEPRLFDEVLDWLALSEPLMSVHRLRNLCATATDRALADSALAWVARARRRERPSTDAPPAHDIGDLEPLFPALTAPSSDLDPAFSRYELARSHLERSGKSQPPRLHDPISFALRLRRLLGVGVRAEVVRTLLTIRADRLSGRVITASAGFAQRNVREGLTQLHEAGVITVAELSDDRYYSTSTARWAALLGLASAPDLPFHYDWIDLPRTDKHRALATAAGPRRPLGVSAGQPGQDARLGDRARPSLHRRPPRSVRGARRRLLGRLRRDHSLRG